jgi:hypothetical protein
MRLNISIPILALALFAPFVAGCGGGDEAPPPSKAAFIKQADGICKRMDIRVIRELKEFAQTHPKIENGPSEKGVTSIFVTTIALPEIQKEAESIAALPAPKGDEKEIEAIVSEIEAGIKETEKGDVTRIFTNDRGRFQNVYHMGTAYGFKACNEAL